MQTPGLASAPTHGQTKPGSSLAAATRLARIAAALEAGVVPAAVDGGWLAVRLRTYLEQAQHGLDLDTACEVSPAPGQSPWWQEVRRQSRDELLRRLGGELPGSKRAKAAALQAMLRQYAGTSWPRDRRTGQPTARNRVLYELFRLDPDPPTSLRRLAEIVSSPVSN